MNLINDLMGVKTIERVGTCGAIQKDVPVRGFIVKAGRQQTLQLIFYDLSSNYLPTIWQFYA